MDSNREKLPKVNNITLTSNVTPLINLSVINPGNLSNESFGSVLKFHRSNLLKKLIVYHININSVRNKFEILKSMLSEVLDILIIIETKLVDSFPGQKFHTEDFNMPFRLDLDRYRGGFLLCFCNNNAFLIGSYVFTNNIEAFFIEIL